MIQRKCKICNREFVINKHNQITCADEACKTALENIHRSNERLRLYGCIGYRIKKCTVCGKQYKPKSSNQKCCLDTQCAKTLTRNLKNKLQKKYYTKHKNSPNYVIKRYILRALRRMLKQKQCHSIRYVSYGINDLKNSIEGKFKDGMSWHNYGQWHIDHIKPLSMFNFIDDNGHENIHTIRTANALGNLQPLWAIDNLRKNNRYCGAPRDN